MKQFFSPHSYLHFFISTIALSLPGVMVYAQAPSEVFGVVSKEDLAMRTYAGDSSAEAVVIFDKGKAVADPASHYKGTTYDRHVRIKILKESALNRANFSFLVDNEVRHVDVKAVTYSLENGAVISEELPQNAIIISKYDKFSKMWTFTLPRIKVGSIFEVSYHYVNEAAYLPSWTFQSDIPTIKSDFILDSPAVEFMFYLRGLLKPTDYEVRSKNKYGRWLMLNVPAFKEEPMMSESDSYTSVISFVTEHDTWALINKDFGEWEFENNVIRYSDFFKNYAKQFSATIPDSTERIKAVVEFLKKNIPWDGTLDIYPDKAETIIKNKQATSADLNMVLASMLDYMGFKVNFVLISTRAHGFIREDFPAWRQFNYVICRVKVKNSYILLDATEKALPYDVLPERCYNRRGFLVAKKGHQWIDIVPTAKKRTQASATLAVQDDELVGKLTTTHLGFSAYQSRSDYFKKSADTYFSEATAGKTWTVHSRHAPTADAGHEPFKENYDLVIHNHVTTTPNSIFVNPFVVLWDDMNPFREEVRNYPVDLSMPFERTMLSTIAIPQGFSLAAMPENKIFAMKDNAARCSFNFTEANGNIVVTTKMQVNKTFFFPDEYHDLREFYARILAKKNEQIEFVKK